MADIYEKEKKKIRKAWDLIAHEIRKHEQASVLPDKFSYIRKHQDIGVFINIIK